MSAITKHEHTPGPWTYSTDDHNRGRIYANGLWIGTTWKADENGAAIPAIENARLIAAAPDLLEALARLCKHATECEMHGEPSQVDGIEWNDVLAARAVIAKAVGE